MRHDAALSVPLFCLYYAVAVVILVVEVTQQLPLLKMVHGMKALPGWFRYMLVVRQLYNCNTGAMTDMCASLECLLHKPLAI